jgi:S1-C subfamily serine protease
MFSPATGFVIGEKDGQILMATNHHVIEDQAFCDETKVTFEILKIKGLSCDKVLATDTTLDLTLFTVKGLNAADKPKLLEVMLPMSKVEPKKGQNLLTVGYGFAGNDDGRLMVDQGHDCKTFSKDGDVRLLADPDTVNPGPYKTWVFATGCDVSHGDSGSALVDRTTGEVVGLLSTGKIPKIESVRSSEYLKTMFDTDSESVWSELTYVVPFAKILESYGEVVSENTSVHPK